MGNGNPRDSIELGVDGVEVGHWTDVEARTGCTVIVFPPGTVGSGEIRGGAPATREFALLDPGRIVDRVDAVVLSGGSAFGLAAAEGVVDELERMGRGFPTPAGVVPIVVGMSLFDLGVGDGSVRPDGRAGSLAFAARSSHVEVGPVGAGTGATYGNWRGTGAARPGGLGIASIGRGDLVVSAVVAVNAAGDIDDGELDTVDRITDGSFDEWPDRSDPFANTTLGVVVTNAALDKAACHLVAQGGHDGLARVIVPAHTRTDGDAIVVAATGVVDASVDELRLMAVAAVVTAVRRGVGTLQA